MSRSRVWCLYYDDLGANYALLVPKYQQEQVDWGWFLVSDQDFTVYRLAASITPRHVWGVDDSGHRARRVCSTTGDPTFQGYVTSFQNYNAIGELVTYQVTGKVGERATVMR